jgi:hypothetical protein
MQFMKKVKILLMVQPEWHAVNTRLLPAHYAVNRNTIPAIVDPITRRLPVFSPSSREEAFPVPAFCNAFQWLYLKLQDPWRSEM